MQIFAGSVKSPWAMTIADAEGVQGIFSAVVSNKSIQLRTIDKVVQEDARQLSFNGQQVGKLRFGSNFPEDLRAYSSSQPALTVQLKVDMQPTQPVLLNMHCEVGCENKVDISEHLSKISGKGWQSLSVDVACFDADPQRLAKVFAPFNLETDGQLKFSFSEISWQLGAAAEADIRCQ